MVTVYVMLAPGGRATVSLMVEPLGENPLAPPAPTAVKVIEVTGDWNIPGITKASVIVAPVTATGPLFTTRIKYVVLEPAGTVPPVLDRVSDRSATALTVVASVSVLLLVSCSTEVVETVA